MQLHIPFAEISEHGMRLTIGDRSWLPEELQEKVGEVNAEVQLTKKSDSRIEVQGNLRAEISLICDRCLAAYLHRLAAPLHLIVEVPQAGRHWRLQDMDTEEGGADLDTLQVAEPEVDLADILRQQFYLGLPLKQLCREDCRGLCSHCGRNLNAGQCGCHDEKAASSPFAVLAGYKKKKNDRSGSADSLL